MIPKERWISALYLGRKKERLALPILITILTEYLPSEEIPLPDNMMWFKEQQEVLDQFKRDLTEREGSFIHDEPIEEN